MYTETMPNIIQTRQDRAYCQVWNVSQDLNRMIVCDVSWKAIGMTSQHEDDPPAPDEDDPPAPDEDDPPPQLLSSCWLPSTLAISGLGFTAQQLPPARLQQSPASARCTM
eukprot:GHVS01028339.1.p2 GENE.GHVS01028339.1~~GHVS01028339.1.p2  ORF type:complete len:110 (-),score=16.05 GHVS01028339.1:180-509(-)